VAGISYYFLARAKGKAVISPKKVMVSLKEAVVSPKEVSLKGILYSEDNSSALIGETIVREGDIIDGVKVVKINKDTVEFERDGEKWTQRTK
jgi:type II secretory pathway component PulC